MVKAGIKCCPRVWYIVSVIFPFLDSSRLLISLLMYFSEINGEEKPSVAICDGSRKYIYWTTVDANDRDPGM